MHCFYQVSFALLISANCIIGATTANDGMGLWPEQCFCLQQVASGLHSPVAAIFYLEDGKERMLLVEQRGLVYKMTMDGTVLEIFLDIQNRVVTSHSPGDSRGLLSIALDPTNENVKKVYVYYIRNHESRNYAFVSVFDVVNGRADHQSERYLLRMYQPFDGGNGGPMFFGDDGYLYIVTGDGGERDDPNGNAQNKDSFLGKVLRLDVTSGEQDFSQQYSGAAKLYGIPKTNPFINDASSRPEVFALGIRNMWGCSQDSLKNKGTGRIFCAETGTNKFDEINIIQSGMNYGWSVREGTVCRLNITKDCPTLENEKFPILEFPHNKSHALVGGYVYRGQRFKNLFGVYIFGDAVTGKTYLMEESGENRWTSPEWSQCGYDKCPTDSRQTLLKHILSFGQDLKNELYLLMSDEFSIHSNKGKIFALLPHSISPCVFQDSYITLTTMLCVLWFS